ncbi:aminotransferase class V-fold PLP-dependent enzyme [Vallicoccus soli]|uniref:Aminotransferase class V-fold PLP-dependent enzyme n=1 Tax=Vallicoccus soli TaxID=2339232 RepID=A0A3A3YW12_9ACTN|nr:aminotransferase class V-fold PLP-dependent enzyme [Vallicoccus soli]RJK94877.1 aminotransferase class V-fold PLP-dependent enzyme [Vallicoccus soli]
MPLVGDGVLVPVAGGPPRPYVDLDAAASTSPSVRVAAAVADFLPWCSSVHRGAGLKSRVSSERFEQARDTVLRFVGADPVEHQAVFVRGTTEALNVAAARLGLTRDDVVLTTVAEHHSNLLPWRRHAAVRYVDVDVDGTFTVDDVVAGLDASPRPKVLALTGASNVTGWVPPLAEIAAAARARGVLVVVDGAQLAPHRPVRMAELGIDVLALSGHKMHAPYGAGALVAPRRLLAQGEPLLVGGGAVSAVGLHDVQWGPAPDRDEAGSPNVVGVVALDAAVQELGMRGWAATLRHERRLAAELDRQLATVPGLVRYGPRDADALALATFNLEGVPHGLVAARLSYEHGIGVRSGCFCAHPLVTRLLGLDAERTALFREQVRRGDHHDLPGAVRASTGHGSDVGDVVRLGEALRAIAASPGRAADYEVTGSGEHVPRDAAAAA